MLINKINEKTKFFFKVFNLIFVITIFLFNVNLCKAEVTSEQKKLSVVMHSDDIKRIDDKHIAINPKLKHVMCVTENIGLDYDLYDISWGYAQFLLKNNKLDILAFASENSFRDTSAIKSNIVYQEKFNIAYDDTFHKTLILPNKFEEIVSLLIKRNYRVGVIASSSEQKKLQENNINNFIYAIDLDDMYFLLKNGKIDVFVSSLENISQYEIDKKVSLKKVFLFEIPRLYYVKKRIVKSYPNFMELFNKAIGICNKKIRLE